MPNLSHMRKIWHAYIVSVSAREDQGDSTSNVHSGIRSVFASMCVTASCTNRIGKPATAAAVGIVAARFKTIGSANLRSVVTAS